MEYCEGGVEGKFENGDECLQCIWIFKGFVQRSNLERIILACIDSTELSSKFVTCDCEIGRYCKFVINSQCILFYFKTLK